MSSLDALMAVDGEDNSYQEDLAALEEGLEGDDVDMEGWKDGDEALLEEGELDAEEWKGGGECGAEDLEPSNLATAASADDLSQRKAEAWRVAQAALQEAEQVQALKSDIDRLRAQGR